MIWLKRKIRKWLGLGESFIGVDLGIKDQSCIVVVSRMNNGQVRIIDARFPSLVEMEKLIRDLQERYGISNKETFRDYTAGFKGKF